MIWRVTEMTRHTWEKSRVGKQIGINLKHMRKNRGMSLEKLAEKTGVSKPTLIHIERGEANPTLAIIWKIADGLNIPVGALLSIETNVLIARRNNGIKLTSSDQAFVVEPLFPSQGSYELYRGQLRPHSTYASSAHPAGVLEYITVMAGDLELKIGDKTYRLATGDAIRFKGDVDHVYSNPSAHPAVLHFVMAYRA
jgi:transcriptional regulator with XRE-family HTH domain